MGELALCISNSLWHATLKSAVDLAQTQNVSFSSEGLVYESDK